MFDVSSMFRWTVEGIIVGGYMVPYPPDAAPHRQFLDFAAISNIGALPDTERIFVEHYAEEWDVEILDRRTPPDSENKPEPQPTDPSEGEER